MLFWLSETGKIWGFQAFWSCSVNFPHYGDPLAWNWSYLGFLGNIWRTCGSKCRGEAGGIFPTLCVECCLVVNKIVVHYSFTKAYSKCPFDNKWALASTLYTHPRDIFIIGPTFYRRNLDILFSTSLAHDSGHVTQGMMFSVIHLSDSLWLP